LLFFLVATLEYLSKMGKEVSSIDVLSLILIGLTSVLIVLTIPLTIESLLMIYDRYRAR
jgi:hypothetical protein